jgi:cbb3-type cytochrome oxidase subunit 3
MEEPLSKFWAFEWGRGDAPWITARSPYPLEDQSLNSTIRVKAIDKAGNEYIATLVPDEELRGISTEEVVTWGGSALVAVLVIIIVAISVHFYLKRRKRKQQEALNIINN